MTEPCLLVTLDYYRGYTENVDGGLVALGAILGFLLGVLIAVVIAKCCMFDLLSARSKDQGEILLLENVVEPEDSSDEEEEQEEKKKEKEEHKDPEQLSNASLPADAERKARPSPSTISRDSGLYDMDDPLYSDSLVVALIKPKSEDMDNELRSQDFRATVQLEKELREQKNNSFLQILRIFLNGLFFKEKIDEKQYRNILTKHEKSIQTGEEEIRAELQQAEEEVMADERLQKDPVAMQEALEKLHPQYVQRMNSLLKEQQESVRQDLSTAGLPQNELEKIMSKFVDNMATVDRLMGEQFARQSLALQERLAKRQRLAGEHAAAQEREEEEVKERMIQQQNTLDKLCQDTKLLDKQRDSIWAQYQSDMQRVEENYNADLQVQQDVLKEKLQQRRQHKLQKLAAKEEMEKEELNNSAAEGQTDPKDFVKAQHDLMIQQQQRRLNILEELDESEAEELSMLKQQLDSSRGQQLLEHDQSLYENLQARAQLSEKEARKLMKKHQLHMKNFQERQDEERERQREQLDAKLAQRRRKLEEQSATSQAEQKMLNDQQERAITMLLDTQAGLTEEARKQIMKEHEQNMIAVNNQLQISRTRQQKILEQKLAQRRAKLEAKTKAKQDEKKMLEEEYEEMVQQLEEERQQALTELRKRLAEETDQALKAQDEQLGKVIARLQLGQARRQSIIRRQEKAIKELQEQLVDKVAESGQVSDTKTERILQNHYREVELINEQLQNSRERQMRALQEKLEVKQLNRQRAIEEKLDKEEKEQLKYEHRRGSLSASAVLTKMLMDRRHEAAMDDLEREMKLELARQTDQLNQELEEQMRGELEDREKDLLSKLAVMGNMSKKQLTEAVEEAVEKVGGNADAKKLTKDLAKRMKRPGTAGVGAERDEDVDGYRPRPKTATGDGYDDGIRPGKLPKIKKKKPKKAFSDDYDDE
ncbi:uncharacterized protein LOC144910347 isoform X2 [Branchiostoma floridae x Branchiostoma belcheri]